MIGSELRINKGPDGLTIMLLAGAAFVTVAVRSYLTTPYDPLFEAAGERYNVQPNLLRAFARKENPQFRPLAVNKNTNGTRDLGIMQVNNTNASKLGYSEQDLFDPNKNIHAAALLISRMRQELGSSYSYHNLISAYNVGTPRVKASGIVNAAYVGEVVFHHTMYELGRVFA